MAHQPTKKERKFVKEYVKAGGNGTAAALAAYQTDDPKQAATIASKNLQKPKIQSMLQEELKRQNITLERALAPISKALTATMITHTGAVVDDLDTQLKGSDRAIKLLLPDLKDANNPNIIAEVKSITINIKNYRK